MAGSAAYRLQQAANAFRSTSGAAGGKASSTIRQDKGVPWTFSTGRQGKTAPQIRVGGVRGVRGFRPAKSRVCFIREFVPGASGKTDLSRIASARVYKQLGIRVARGDYFLVSPTGGRTLAVPGKYTLEDGSVLVV